MDFHKILIVSDYDGTLTGEGHKVPESNLKALRYFIENGGAFCLGSGRGMPMLRDEIAELPINVPCVLSNGAVLYDYQKEELVEAKSFSEEERELIGKAMEALRPDNCMMMESGIHDYYMPQEVADRFGVGNEDSIDPERRWMLRHIIRPNTRFAPLNEIPEPWLKVTFYGNHDEMEELQKVCEKLGLNGQFSAPGLYELQPSGVNKGTAARRLSEILDRPVLVCIGDEDNDLAMLCEADYGFVTESAKESMRNRGFLPCAVSSEGAAADVIRQLEAM